MSVIEDSTGPYQKIDIYSLIFIIIGVIVYYRASDMSGSYSFNPFLAENEDRIKKAWNEHHVAVDATHDTEMVP